MMTTDSKHDFTSIGQLAAHLQRPVRAIERAALSIGLVPSLRLNNIPHFDAEQVQKLTDHFREAREH